MHFVQLYQKRKKGRDGDFRRPSHILREHDCKPGSVFDSHLSTRRVAAVLQPPRERSGQPIAPIPVLLRIEFTASDTLEPMGELLPRLSTLTSEEAVYLCCTFPEVAFGGRYPLSLPCGARTFLTEGPFAPSARLSVFLAGLLYAKQREKSMGSRSIREDQSLVHGVEAGETPAG